MSNPSEIYSVPISVQLDKAIQESMILKARQFKASVQASVDSPNRADELILEVLKGVIAKAMA